MKITSFALFTSLIVSADATGLRDLVLGAVSSSSAAAAPDAVVEVEVEAASEPNAAAIAVDAEGQQQQQRELQSCWNNKNLVAKWHPQYSAGWASGYCRLTIDCNSPSYNTELACCKGAYAGQTSGFCLSQLPAPPTTSPTTTGGLSVYYPDYGTPWDQATCINMRPMPSGRPTYTSQLACCKGAYAGQMSGACFLGLPSPPSTSPTTDAREADFWYPRYEDSWANSGCSNALPLPYNNKRDRPFYESQLACCKAAYGGQTSGTCLGELPSPPTTSPTATGGFDFFYPDYETPWDQAGCKNDRPLPFLTGGRPTYSTMLACCKGAYGGQTSGTCFANLPSPPTTSPTATGGFDFFYPDYETPWASATCKNDRPLPFTTGGRPTYSSQLACCKGAYASQTSGACLTGLDNPPTTSPTVSGGLSVWYPNYTTWSTGKCINDRPLPSGRISYSTQQSCCSGAYGSQTNHYCYCDLDPCFSCMCSGSDSWRGGGGNCPALLATSDPDRTYLCE